MRSNTKKWPAILCAIGFIALLALYLCVIMFAFISERTSNIAAVLLILVFLGVIVGVIAGILLALRQRLREIDGGEEDEARKY